MRIALVTTLLIPLAACGTPQERCIARETRDLRILGRLIAETEADLKRGYALEEVTVWTPRWRACEGQPAPAPGGEPTLPQMCLEDEAQTVTRPKAIDLAQTRSMLAEMRQKEAELTRAAGPAIDACKATYPQ